ncbi:MAG: hypothetical protein PHR61_01985 [Candidatus Absconditabacteria bacterium]|nr:hypothetical protein [Candidatus Absconditabacteria bacterium]
MKKTFVYLLGVFMVMTLTGCTIDWNNEKANEINRLEGEISSLKSKIEDQNFEKNLKCNALFDGLKRKYYNVYSVYYDAYMDSCYVKYKDTKTKELNEALLEDFGPN